MKASLAGLALVLAACSVSHRSQDYACVKTSDCSQGRTCVGGFCVIPGGGGPIDAPGGGSSDASKPRPDAPGTSCPPGCSSCDTTQHTCTIDCTQTNCANTDVTCPQGYDCTIKCNADGACRGTVQCNGNSACNITCSSSGSCRDVQCADGKCQVACTGQGSCRNVSCNSSCACDVTCSGSNSCSNFPQCTAPACDVFPRGCTSANLNCSSQCP